MVPVISALTALLLNGTSNVQVANATRGTDAAVAIFSGRTAAAVRQAT